MPIQNTCSCCTAQATYIVNTTAIMIALNRNPFYLDDPQRRDVMRRVVYIVNQPLVLLLIVCTIRGRLLSTLITKNKCAPLQCLSEQ